jgi:hypothetical protein
MIKRQIKDWLNTGGSFQKGYKLFQLSGGQSVDLAKILDKKFISSKDKALLRDLLDQLLQTLPDEVAPLALAEVAMSEPTSIVLLREEGKKLKKRESFVHAHLVAEAFGNADQGKLYEFAKEMMEDIHPQLDDVYDTIRSFEKDGTLPADEKQKIIEDTILKMNKKKNMQTRLYRLQKWLKDPAISEEQKTAYQREIEEKEQSIKDIKELLGL